MITWQWQENTTTNLSCIYSNSRPNHLNNSASDISSYKVINIYKAIMTFVNKLWCKSTTNPVPVLRIAASHGFLELTKNVIRSSHGYSTPSLKISCKSVQRFPRNVADKEISIAASRGFSNWPKIESRHPMVTPHLPWKFHANRSSRFLVILLTKKHKQTKIQTKKSIENNTRPRSIGDGVIINNQHKTYQPKSRRWVWGKWCIGHTIQPRRHSNALPHRAPRSAEWSPAQCRLFVWSFQWLQLHGTRPTMLQHTN